MVVVMKNLKIKREAVTARTRYKVQVIGTVIDADRAAWQGLCYQRHRSPPLQTRFLRKGGIPHPHPTWDS